MKSTRPWTFFFVVHCSEYHHETLRISGKFVRRGSTPHDGTAQFDERDRNLIVEYIRKSDTGGGALEMNRGIVLRKRNLQDRTTVSKTFRAV